MIFALYVCEMIHLHHKYIKKAMMRGLTMHHHLVCAVGNNAMKHSYIVPPPLAASACCMVSPYMYRGHRPRTASCSYVGGFFMWVMEQRARNKEPRQSSLVDAALLFKSTP